MLSCHKFHVFYFTTIVTLNMNLFTWWV
jgi:hypothetical protein